MADPNAPYDLSEDIMAGGSHHDPSKAEGAYDLSEDSRISAAGGNPAMAKTIANLPPMMLTRSWKTLADIANTDPEPSQTPIRDLAQNAAAGVVRGAANAGDLLTHPEDAILRPLLVGGTNVYDMLAPKVGLPQTSPALHALLTEPEPGAATYATKQVGQAIGADPYAVIPRTPLESRVATGAESATTGAIAGGLTPLGAGRGAVLGGIGGVGGSEVSNFVDPRWRAGTEMAVNMLLQMVGNKAMGRPGANIDPSTVPIAQRGREQGIPFAAPDITPGTMFRSEPHVRATADALQGNIVRDLGGNPITNDPATPPRITPDLMRRTRTDTSQGLDDIGNNNSINPAEAAVLNLRLQRLANDANSVAGATPHDYATMQQRIDEVRQRINPTTGMPGNDYMGLTASDSPLANLASSDNSRVANIGQQAMGMTREAFRNSLPPDVAARDAALRYRWRLMNAVEPLVERAQGQSIDMGGLADSLLEQSQRYDHGRNGMAYTGGGQLGDYMSQARLIAGGPAVQGGGPITEPLMTPQGVTAISGSHPTGAVSGLMLRGALEKLVGPYARSDYRTNQIFDAATSPRAHSQINLGLLGSASVP